MKNLKNFLAVLLIGTVGALAVSWFPEGDAPQSGDNEKRSLQKINNLLYTSTGSGSGSGGVVTVAPAITSATAIVFQGDDATITDAPIKLATALGLATAGETYYVRQVSIYWREDNTDNVRFGPTGEATYRPLSPGEEYVIGPIDGGRIDMNSIRIYCPTASYSGVVSVLYLR